ncbi:MAG: Nif3-like dinuclear metal center hexameric protein [Spirochaetia bacterium]|nr:Nif3-like dinuclear metal center hexameric protein [Spirochaetia bacterium]
MKRSELVDYLDSYLEIDAFTHIDRSLNSLVVGTADRDIKKVAFAVDACQQSFEEAAAWGAQLLIVHHGLFWGSPIAVCGAHYRRLKTLFESELDLYVAHLPLDAHPEVGNNAIMAKKLGLVAVEPFASYKGRIIGFKGNLEKEQSLAEVCKRLSFENPTLLAFGKQKVKSVGLVSGSASDDVHQALSQHLDCFITGEVEHQIYHDALEGGINVIGGGHYQSEVFGLQALSEHLSKTFALEVSFIANPTGL